MKGPFTSLGQPPRARNGQVDPQELARWMDRLWRILSSEGGVGWPIISKDGGSLVDLPSRPHSALHGVEIVTPGGTDEATAYHVTEALATEWSNSKGHTIKNAADTSLAAKSYLKFDSLWAHNVGTDTVVEPFTRSIMSFINPENWDAVLDQSITTDMISDIQDAFVWVLQGNRTLTLVPDALYLFEDRGIDTEFLLATPGLIPDIIENVTIICPDGLCIFRLSDNLAVDAYTRSRSWLRFFCDDANGIECRNIHLEGIIFDLNARGNQAVNRISSQNTVRYPWVPYGAPASAGGLGACICNTGVKGMTVRRCYAMGASTATWFLNSYAFNESSVKLLSTLGDFKIEDCGVMPEPDGLTKTDRNKNIADYTYTGVGTSTVAHMNVEAAGYTLYMYFQFIITFPTPTTFSVTIGLLAHATVDLESSPSALEGEEILTGANIADYLDGDNTWLSFDDAGVSWNSGSWGGYDNPKDYICNHIDPSLANMNSTPKLQFITGHTYSTDDEYTFAWAGSGIALTEGGANSLGDIHGGYNGFTDSGELQLINCGGAVGSNSWSKTYTHNVRGLRWHVNCDKVVLSQGTTTGVTEYSAELRNCFDVEVIDWTFKDCGYGAILINNTVRDLESLKVVGGRCSNLVTFANIVTPTSTLSGINIIGNRSRIGKVEISGNTLISTSGYMGHGIEMHYTTTPFYVAETATKVRNFPFEYQISSIWRYRTSVETALGTTVIPSGTYGAVSFDIGVNGTIDVVEATDNATGYASSALALAGLPAVAASHVRAGTLTVTKSDGDFTLGTTALNAANVTVSFAMGDPTNIRTQVPFDYCKLDNYIEGEVISPYNTCLQKEAERSYVTFNGFTRNPIVSASTFLSRSGYPLLGNAGHALTVLTGAFCGLEMLTILIENLTGDNSGWITGEYIYHENGDRGIVASVPSTNSVRILPFTYPEYNLTTGTITDYGRDSFNHASGTITCNGVSCEMTQVPSRIVPKDGSPSTAVATHNAGGGYYSGKTLTGSYNTWWGDGAFQVRTTGYGGTAIGAEAGAINNDNYSLLLGTLCGIFGDGTGKNGYIHSSPGVGPTGLGLSIDGTTEMTTATLQKTGSLVYMEFFNGGLFRVNGLLDAQAGLSVTGGSTIDGWDLIGDADGLYTDGDFGTPGVRLINGSYDLTIRYTTETSGLVVNISTTGASGTFTANLYKLAVMHGSGTAQDLSQDGTPTWSQLTVTTLLGPSNTISGSGLTKLKGFGHNAFTTGGSSSVTLNTADHSGGFIYVAGANNCTINLPPSDGVFECWICMLTTSSVYFTLQAGTGDYLVTDLGLSSAAGTLKSPTNNSSTGPMPSIKVKSIDSTYFETMAASSGTWTKT